MNHIGRHRIRGGGGIAWALSALVLAGCAPGRADDDDSAPAPRGPDLLVSPGLVDFGEVGVRGMAERAVLLESVGDEAVSADWSLSDPARFAVVEVSGAPEDLAPGSSATLVVRYVPGGVEHVIETLTIESNDPDAPTIVVQLRGDGVE